MKQNLRFLMLTLLCAVFSTAWGGEATFSPAHFSGQGTSGTGSAISATVDGVTFSCDKGYGTTQIRCYSGGNITISSSKTITAISFTFSGNSYTGGLETSYTGLETKSWEKALSSQARITEIKVTYEGEQSGPQDPIIAAINDMSLKVGGSKTFTVSSTSNGAISVSSGDTEVATVSGSDTNWTVTAVGVGTTTITINQEAVTDKFNAGTASFDVTVTEATIPVNALLYEGVNNYSGTGDSNELSSTSDYLDYKNWSSSMSKIYASPNGYENGGCLKFGSGSAIGSLTAESIALEGSGMLSFWLKQYGSDTGKMTVTVIGAAAEDADDNGTITFTPESTWKQYTVSLSEANGAVTIAFATTSKRAYLDEIQLIAVSTNKVAKPTFSPNGGSFTEAQTVTITCATEGASIYYTTDGTDPTTSSTQYNNNNKVNVTTTNTTLKAIAVLDGMENSNIAESELFTIQPEAPVISEQDSKIVITAANGLTIYCTTDGSDPTNENEENKYTEPIPFSGTVTVKAIAYDTYGNPSAVSTKTFEFTNIRPNPKNINSGYYVKVADASELEAGDAILFVSEIDGLAMSTIQNANNRGAAEVTLGNGFIVDPSEDVQKVILTVDPEESGVWYFYVDNGYLYAASSEKNYLRTEDNPDGNAKATISISNGDATIQFQGSYTRNILKYNPNTNGNNPLFSCYGENSTNEATTQIYKEVEAQTETVNIGSTKYATLYYGTENLIVPANVTAMTYKASGEKIAVSKTYASGEVIPAGTAVVLEGTAAGAYNFFVTTVEGESDSDNNLYGRDEAGETVAPGSGSYLFYKLSTNSAGAEVGFYFGAENGAAFNIPAHKAYLAIPGTYTTPGGASAFVFDETVGINTVQKEALSAEGIYTLSGIRVNGDNLTKGIYIVNGKKIVIK